MLMRMMVAALVGSTLIPATLAQTRDADAQTLRDILAEIRAIHEDMRVTETTQLLVAQLEMQQGVVNRATENADTARAKLSDLHLDQKHVATELETLQEHLDKASTPDERNALSTEIERQKSNQAELKNAERDRTATLQQMEQRLQAAQDKLSAIEDELTAVVARLGPMKEKQ